MAELIPAQLPSAIRQWATEFGFAETGFSSTDIGEHESRLLNWLRHERHGEMQYMARNTTLRCNPASLHPGTISIISVRMDYSPPRASEPWSVINDPNLGYVSRYATGRDYHKLMRKRLQQLATRIAEQFRPFGYRAFVDSAPVMEKALAQAAGLGWIGKHTNLINRSAGSWFFLGELYTDLPLPASRPFTDNHCGSCQACIDVCPTAAIIAPYQLDARRCISYLTIELRGSIPVELRPLIGNRIYGCDDCQLVCPWNKFACNSKEEDFNVRNQLDAARLIELFAWSEQQFLDRLQGSAIRRIGHHCWLRNIAVAMGNAPASDDIRQALITRTEHESAMVREHVRWALDQHAASRSTFAGQRSRTHD